MSNRYCNLVGGNKIDEEYQKIADGFEAVQEEIDDLGGGLSGIKTSQVSNDSNVTGEKLNNALDALRGALDVLDASQVINNSNVIGSKVRDALNRLQTQINVMVLGGSNSLIGTYDVVGIGTGNTIYGEYYGVAELWDGLKVNLTLPATNTDVVTFSLNMYPADRVVYLDEFGEKQEIDVGMFIEDAVVQIRYDGEDWVVLFNGAWFTKTLVDILALASDPLSVIDNDTIPSNRLKTTSDSDKIQMANLSAAVLAAMNGESPTGVTPADSSVTEIKIATGAVTEGKLASGAVTNTKIGTKAVKTSNLFDNTKAAVEFLEDRISYDAILFTTYTGTPTTRAITTTFRGWATRLSYSNETFRAVRVWLNNEIAGAELKCELRLDDFTTVVATTTKTIRNSGDQWVVFIFDTDITSTQLTDANFYISVQTVLTTGCRMMVGYVANGARVSAETGHANRYITLGSSTTWTDVNDISGNSMAIDFITSANLSVVGNSSITENLISPRAVTNSKIKDKSVTEAKTSFFDMGKNKFNKYTVTSGYGVVAATGAIQLTTNFSASDYIPCLPDTAYFKYGGAYAAAFYDSDFTFISGVSLTTFTTPANTAYMRISVYNPDLNAMQVEVGSSGTSYEAFSWGLPDSIVKIESITESKIAPGAVTNTKIGTKAVKSSNLFDSTKTAIELLEDRLSYYSVLFTTYTGNPSTIAISSTFRGWATRISYASETFRAVRVNFNLEYANYEVKCEIVRDDFTTIVASASKMIRTAGPQWAVFIFDSEITVSSFILGYDEFGTPLIDSNFFLRIQTVATTGCRLQSSGAAAGPRITGGAGHGHRYIATGSTNWSDMNNASYPLACDFITSANLMLSPTIITDNAITEAKINNGAVTNSKIGTGAVNTIKIATKAITEAKTTFYTRGKNLFDKTTVTAGYGVSSTTGLAYLLTDFSISDYIPVEPNTAYIKSGGAYNIAYYDSTYTFISGAGSTTTFTTPANTAYIRISVYNTNLNTQQVELGSTNTSYEAFGWRLPDSIIRDGMVTENKLAAGAVTNSKLAAGAVRHTNLEATTQLAVGLTIDRLSLAAVLFTSYTGSVTANTVTSTFRGWSTRLSYSNETFRAIKVYMVLEYAGYEVKCEIVLDNHTTIVATTTKLSTVAGGQWVLFIFDTDITSAQITDANFYVRVQTVLTTGCRMNVGSKTASARVTGTTDNGNRYITLGNATTWSNMGNAAYPLAMDFVTTANLILPGVSDGDVTENKIAANAVTNSKIALGAIKTTNLATNTKAAIEILEDGMTSSDTVFATYTGAVTAGTISSTFRGWATRVSYSNETFRAVSVYMNLEFANFEVLCEILKDDFTTIVATSTKMVRSSGGQWVLFIFDTDITSTQLTDANFYVRVQTVLTTGCRMATGVKTTTARISGDSGHPNKYVTTGLTNWVNNVSPNGNASAIAFIEYSKLVPMLVSLVDGTVTTSKLDTEVLTRLGNCQVSLPSKMYGLVGKEINIYFDNVISDKDVIYDFNVVCSVGVHQNERWTYVPSVAGTNSLTIEVYLNGVFISSATTSIIIKAAAVGTGANKKILVLGDSTTASNTTMGELNTLFNSDPMDITFLGTKGNSPAFHEAVSGWKAYIYCHLATDGAVSNLFFNNNTFDFSYYMNAQGYASVDYVIINLGINDTFGSETDGALASALVAILADYTTMINSIHAFDANIKIGLCLTIPPSYYQDSFGKNYSCGQTRWRYKRNNFTWIKTLVDTWGSSEGSQIYLIPINANIDTVHNEVTETVAINSRNSATIVRQSNGVHPTAIGYYQIADILYYWLKGFET
jgi:lysophospholipase L1-like esterase